MPCMGRNGRKSMTEVLCLKNLSKHFIITGSNIKGKTIIDAVKDISFCIYKGDSFGLIGESGSGKTTTANLVLKLLEPTSGSISLFGKDITKMDEGRYKGHYLVGVRILDKNGTP